MGSVSLCFSVSLCLSRSLQIGFSNFHLKGNREWGSTTEETENQRQGLKVIVDERPRGHRMGRKRKKGAVEDLLMGMLLFLYGWIKKGTWR
jgi:hypothetical protein